MALTIVAIALVMGRPVFFIQKRPGLDERMFWLLKFRTMKQAYDSDNRLLPDASRLTPLGRILRATSIDELPQLVNVLRGDMSLVGPRPLLPEYLHMYTLAQRRRHEVRPGVTGLAQIRGRNAQTWARRLKLDLWYVEHWSFRLDLIILAHTAVQAVRRSGITHPGHATMPPFKG
jgi:sugar transferase EpsL